jgi:hypothetical protein
VSHKVKEEVSLWHRDHFVGNLYEKAESLARSQVQPLRDALAKVLGTSRRVYLESLRKERKKSITEKRKAEYPNNLTQGQLE